MSNHIEAPFTPEQVESLNAFQESRVMHPFTCGYRDEHPDDEGVLFATPEGWVCTVLGCTYRQTWAHSFMADGTWKQALEALER